MNVVIKLGFCFVPGNIIKPKEARYAPFVNFSDAANDDDALYTLVLSNPDGHFTEENCEYLHWMVANVGGSEDKNVNVVSAGGGAETVCRYLPPFPPFGTGYHRLVFVLYKQVSRLRQSNRAYPTSTCSSFSVRTDG